MYRFQYLLISIFFIFISCNQDDNANDDEPQAQESFYALKVGNTWTYEYFKRVGQTEDFESLDASDVVTITATEEINGKTFFNFRITTTGRNNCGVCPEDGVENKLRRDSLGYLINDFGKIQYATQNVEPYLIYDFEWGDVYGVLREGTSNIIVAAGSFASVENEVYAILEDGSTSNGSSHLYYSDTVGLIKESISGVNNPVHFWEKRLKSYTLVED